MYRWSKFLLLLEQKGTWKLLIKFKKFYIEILPYTLILFSDEQSFAIKKLYLLAEGSEKKFLTDTDAI